MRVRAASGVCLALLAFATASCRAAPSPAGGEVADLMIVNGRVFTADEQGTMAQAVAVAGNKILRVGTDQDLAALRGPGTRVIDAHGASVTPGFNDSHVHFLSGGESLGDVDLAGLTTLPQVQNAIRDFATAKPDVAWVKGRGWLYSPFPGGTPTKAQLDAVVADRPAVMTCYDGHSIWVNSKALAMAGITKDTPNPPNGVVVKDPKTGEPTGHLKESATDLVTGIMPKATAEDRRAALRTAVAHAHRFGVTSVQNAGGDPGEMALYDEARQAGELQVRTYLAFSAQAGTTEADLDRMEEVRKQFGDDPALKTGAVKIYADGVIESRTAALLAPYSNSRDAGSPNLSADELNRLVTMIDKRGWQIWIHAIGDRAIRMSLDALERATAANPAPASGRRHRLEHIETIDAADIPRFARLGVIASQQPMHVPLGDMNSAHPSGPWPDNIGPDRASRAWAWKSIQDAGGRLTFGSDWPVAPLSPGQGIWVAAARTGPSNAVDQKLPVRDVISGYTRWPAYASFEERRKGTLAPGMLADLVVLSADLLARPPATATDVVVETTIFDGQVVYQKPK
ncbi:MAG: amidohydrolase [Acidobacteriota bacterium]|nr:amidohydrolase [Acidobacteriota bacterium]